MISGGAGYKATLRPEKYGGRMVWVEQESVKVSKCSVPEKADKSRAGGTYAII